MCLFSHHHTPHEMFGLVYFQLNKKGRKPVMFHNIFFLLRAFPELEEVQRRDRSSKRSPNIRGYSIETKGKQIGRHGPNSLQGSSFSAMIFYMPLVYVILKFFALPEKSSKSRARLFLSSNRNAPCHTTSIKHTFTHPLTHLNFPRSTSGVRATFLQEGVPHPHGGFGRSWQDHHPVQAQAGRDSDDYSDHRL